MQLDDSAKIKEWLWQFTSACRECLHRRQLLQELLKKGPKVLLNGQTLGGGFICTFWALEADVCFLRTVGPAALLMYTQLFSKGLDFASPLSTSRFTEELRQTPAPPLRS